VVLIRRLWHGSRLSAIRSRTPLKGEDFEDNRCNYVRGLPVFIARRPGSRRWRHADRLFHFVGPLLSAPRDGPYGYQPRSRMPHRRSLRASGPSHKCPLNLPSQSSSTSSGEHNHQSREPKYLSSTRSHSALKVIRKISWLSRSRNGAPGGSAMP
jgi:hypothetical protein